MEKRGERERRDEKAEPVEGAKHIRVSLPACALEISPHTYARNIQRSVAALGGFNPSKLIPFSRSIAHSLCFVLHQLGYAQLPLFPCSILSPTSPFPFLLVPLLLTLLRPFFLHFLLFFYPFRSHVPLPFTLSRFADLLEARVLARCLTKPSLPLPFSLSSITLLPSNTILPPSAQPSTHPHLPSQPPFHTLEKLYSSRSTRNC